MEEKRGAIIRAIGQERLRANMKNCQPLVDFFERLEKIIKRDLVDKKETWKTNREKLVGFVGDGVSPLF